MVSSWFRGSDANKPVSAVEAVKVLYPSKTSHFDRTLESSPGGARARFSQLLLEHGEKPLQDWAVQAFSFPSKGQQANHLNSTGDNSGSGSNNNNNSGSSDQQSNNKSDNKIQWAQSPYRKTQRSQMSRRKTSSTKIDKDSFPSAHMTNIEGRLHLCTGSLVFEPTEMSRGIVRCPFNKMDGSPVEHPTEEGFEAMCVEFTCRRHLVMKANNTIGPYQTVSVPCRFRFSFLHSSPSSFVDLCQKLFQLAADGKSRHSHATPELDHLIKPMLDRPFDPANFVDVREQALTGHLRCSVLTPLQSKPGTLVLTAERLYFQPAAGVLLASTARADSWLQRDVAATARRYHGLRDAALEIYWKRDGSSTLFAFERRHDREQVMRFLSNNVTCFTDREFVVDVAREWQRGNVSNFEYLLALNSAAGRSFHDLSRYPVFPWVIADLTSAKLDLTNEASFRDLRKPVGALNQERLEYFQTRLEGMQDMEGGAFLYGTHYSAPGYVLYFLVRSMPEHMLCLQNGKFDAPDRMFHSVAQCYNCAMSNHADVKELIPEFYNAGSDFDFLINAKGLQLGATQNGDRVNDVTLPPWARSPRDFVKKNRKALESEICTRMLPRWIDLIFGFKSRGEGAMEADNVFHPNAYLGSTDLAGMQTEEERFQAELQATEFGIVPDQLFCQEHPLKGGDDLMDEFISSDIGRASSNKDENSGREAWELLDAPLSLDNAHTTTRLGMPSSLGTENPEIDTTLGDEDLGVGSSSDYLGDRFKSDIDPSSIAETHSLVSTPSRHHPEVSLNPSRESDRELESPTQKYPRSPRNEDSPKVVQQAMEGEGASSDWDMKIIERKSIHNDAVSGCVLLPNETGSSVSILVTSSLDGGLMANSISMDAASTETSGQAGFSSLSRFAYGLGRKGEKPAAQSKLTEYRTHSSRDPLASLVLASDGAGGSVAFAGGHDDTVLSYGIKSACAVASLYSHRDAVTGLDLISRTPFDADCAIWRENATHILVSGSWDATVKVWSVSVASGETVAINREPLAELFDADSSIVCVSAKSLPSGGIVIAAGCADGSFSVWNVHSDGVQVLIHNEPARRGSACSVVRWISEAGKLHLFCAFSTGKLASYALAEDVLHRQSAVSVGVPITSLVYTESVLILGCADGCLLLIPVRDGAYFDSKPTMWKSINNKSTSPGISSISLTYIEPKGETKCVVCTGAEDGSILLFELKKVMRHQLSSS